VMTSNSSSDRQHHPVDTLVHEFCKVFGQHGTPEYGCGVVGFPDFLALMSNDSTIPVRVIILDRQIGSRYFVTTANAANIMFLKEAAVHFLKYTGKDTGNKLERDVCIRQIAGSH